MYSLNAALPPAIVERREALAASLEPFDTVRDPLTLVVKRFGARSPDAVDRLDRAVGELLGGWGPIAARNDGVDAFVDPPAGPGPVVYLTVDSPGLVALHEALAERFGLADVTIEGPRYVPHITLARGGSRADLDALTGRSLAPIEWTVDEVLLWTARYDRPVTRYPLPYRP